MEVIETFEAYSSGWTALSEAQFTALPLSMRRALAHTKARGFRTIWWPQSLRDAGDGPVLRYVSRGVTPSQHAEVDPATWRRAQPVLPRTRELAGTFAPRSGPNCFGTVMAAAGINGADQEWMEQPPFERWLAAHSQPIRGRSADDHAGTVLVWRHPDGLAVHACVTIGDGWVLNKPSQAWCSPRFIWSTRHAIFHSRYRGTHLHRCRLTR